MQILEILIVLANVAKLLIQYFVNKKNTNLMLVILVSLSTILEPLMIGVREIVLMELCK